MPMRYAPDACFDPQVAMAMSAAFNSAWEAVKDAPDMADGKADWARETLGLRIIEAAQRGEHNVARLQEDALMYLAKANRQRPG
jgi:hypothetical protein